MKKAIYTGTFDPFTNGHADILNRAVGVFDQVTVLVAVSPNKTPFFSLEERVAMITELFRQNPKICVDSWEGLIVDYAKKHGIKYLVRGLRPTGDFEIEFQMAAMNKALEPDLETVFFGHQRRPLFYQFFTGQRNYCAQRGRLRICSCRHQ